VATARTISCFGGADRGWTGHVGEHDRSLKQMCKCTLDLQMLSSYGNWGSFSWMVFGNSAAAFGPVQGTYTVCRNAPTGQSKGHTLIRQRLRSVAAAVYGTAVRR
jgi:hypothetical protein